MSDLTALEHGKITLVQFVTKVGGEIAANPLAKMLAPIVLTALQAEITRLLGSSTVAAIITKDVASVVAGQPIALTDEVSDIVAGVLTPGAN